MKVIWLVGASEGIGRATAIKLSEDKNNFLILSARNENRLKNLSTELGSNNFIAPLDVTDKKSISKVWELINSNSLIIDSVIYCAGLYAAMKATDAKLDIVETMIDINLKGAMRILNLIIPTFINRNSGHIALIASIAGYRGLPNCYGYGSTKAGIIHLAENLKCDLAEYNIKIQVICPGFVKTRLTDVNTFYMPGIISAEQAGMNIVKIINTNNFDSRFPFIIGNTIKFLSQLPYWLYFKIMKSRLDKNK